MQKWIQFIFTLRSDVKSTFQGKHCVSVYCISTVNISPRWQSSFKLKEFGIVRIFFFLTKIAIKGTFFQFSFK